MSRQATITLPDELAAEMDRAVSSGAAGSLDEVVRAALDQWRLDRWMSAWSAEEGDAFRRSLMETERERLAGGGHDLDDVFDQVLDDLERRFPEAAE